MTMSEKWGDTVLRNDERNESPSRSRKPESVLVFDPKTGKGYL
jgi:hypothetical protein